MSPQQYIAFRDQVERGTKVEMEHTNDKWVARKIALDHLQENLHYYDYLEKMEKKMEKEPHAGIAKARGYPLKRIRRNPKKKVKYIYSVRYKGRFGSRISALAHVTATSRKEAIARIPKNSLLVSAIRIRKAKDGN